MINISFEKVLHGVTRKKQTNKKTLNIFRVIQTTSSNNDNKQLCKTKIQFNGCWIKLIAKFEPLNCDDYLNWIKLFSFTNI